MKFALALGDSSYPFCILYNWIFLAMNSAYWVVSPLSPTTDINILSDNLNALWLGGAFRIKEIALFVGFKQTMVQGLVQEMISKLFETLDPL